MKYDFGNAQICLNGHILTYKSNDFNPLQNYCSTCGQKIILVCTHCNKPIKGGPRAFSQIENDYVYFADKYQKPSYCYECGNGFPWTILAKESAFEIIKLAGQLTEDEKIEFQSSIENLIIESPRTSVSITKFNKYVTKAGVEIGKALKDILIEIVSEGVKKSIWG